MTNALNFIRYIFNKFIVLIFDDFTIINNVSLGWIFVVIILFSIMISNIISVARSYHRGMKQLPSETYGVTMHANGNETHYYTKRG